jgi:hypothetical protein
MRDVEDWVAEGGQRVAAIKYIENRQTPRYLLNLHVRDFRRVC